MIININKKNILNNLFLEDSGNPILEREQKEIEKTKLLKQNFLNNIPSKDIGAEQQQIAAMNAGVTDPLMKEQLIKINHKNNLIHNHTLDRDNNGVDAQDLKKHLYASKSL